MAIGQSGGRSARNRTSGPRRATQRERDLVDPPGHSEWEHIRVEGEPWVLTTRGEKVLAILAGGLWVFACCFLAVVVCAWFGLL